MDKPLKKLPPMHQKWHRYTPQTSPTDHNKRPRVCICINKSMPSHQIYPTPNDNSLMNWVTINELHPSITRVTLLSVYNTPEKFNGLPHLQN
ncbi:hypothetical protein O181_062522 [Austropuccinia psidii MF-1]|uniref:Uncharacterized protein n=1 Tax=Austropuccinia psidii MF-1 TaxID=1389203 RepID=A0A9Q3I0G1_9BASI|nr:hypothetical protein [Austropuccinia psidii MF-1]